jgi:anti-sigma factor RsiW
MNCTYPIDDVDVYLDGEFVAEDRRLYEEHLAACEPCRAHYQGQRRFRELLDTGLKEGAAHAPADYRQRLESVVRLDYASRARARWRAPMAIAATLALVVTASLLWPGGSGPPNAATASAERDAALEFHGSSLATQEFVTANVRRPVRVPVDEDEDTRLVGARIVRDAGSPAVLFFYEVQGRAVSVLQRPEDLPGPVPSSRRRGRSMPSTVHAVPVSFSR